MNPTPLITLLACLALSGCLDEPAPTVGASCVAVAGYNGVACVFAVPVEGYGDCTFLRTQNGVTLVGCKDGAV